MADYTINLDMTPQTDGYSPVFDRDSPASQRPELFVVGALVHGSKLRVRDLTGQLGSRVNVKPAQVYLGTKTPSNLGRDLVSHILPAAVDQSTIKSGQLDAFRADFIDSDLSGIVEGFIRDTTKPLVFYAESYSDFDFNDPYWRTYDRIYPDPIADATTYSITVVGRPTYSIASGVGATRDLINSALATIINADALCPFTADTSVAPTFLTLVRKVLTVGADVTTSANLKNSGRDFNWKRLRLFGSFGNGGPNVYFGGEGFINAEPPLTFNLGVGKYYNCPFVPYAWVMTEARFKEAVGTNETLNGTYTGELRRINNNVFVNELNSAGTQDAYKIPTKTIAFPNGLEYVRFDQISNYDRSVIPAANTNCYYGLIIMDDEVCTPYVGNGATIFDCTKMIPQITSDKYDPDEGYFYFHETQISAADARFYFKNGENSWRSTVGVRPIG